PRSARPPAALAALPPPLGNTPAPAPLPRPVRLAPPPQAPPVHDPPRPRAARMEAAARLRHLLVPHLRRSACADRRAAARAQRHRAVVRASGNLRKPRPFTA